MTRARMWLAHAVIATVIGGSLLAILTDRERWPFSPYAMYSWARPEPSFTMPVLWGVTEEQPPREIPLYAAAYIDPFDQGRLRDAFKQLQRRPHPERALERALRDCLARYERRRRAGLHDGPALRGMRLYQVSWTLVPWAVNVEQPQGKELLFEVAEPPAQRDVER